MTDTETKIELINSIKLILGAFVMGVHSMQSTDPLEIVKKVNNEKIKLNNNKFFTINISNIDSKQYINDINGILLGAVTMFMFENVKNYCKKTNQLHKFYQQSWYDYFSTMRNTLSHGLKININFDKIKKFPIEFLHAKIKYTDVGKLPTKNNFDGNIFINLVDQINTFVEKDLK